MPVLKINLLRKEQTQVSRLSQATVIVSVVTGSIVLLMLLVVVFLYTTMAIRTGQRDGLIAEQKEYADKASKISSFDQVFYPEMTLAQQASAYQQQLDGIKGLIGSHKYFTLYLSEIAVNTPTTVVYQSFASESSDRLTVTGKAKTYSELSKLTKKFENLSFARGTSIQDARLDKNGGDFPISFTMIIDLKTAAELDKLPGPSSVSGSRKSGSPAPNASKAPATGASAAPLPLGGTD